MKRSTSIALLAVAVIVAAALGIGFTKLRAGAGAPAAPTARPVLTVAVATPRDTDIDVTLAANGNVAAWQEAIVGSESNGLRLADVRANVGDVVRKGQVLATFSPETVNAELAQSRAALAEARAAAADAAGNAARARTLQETGALSQQQINQYQTAEQTARARVEAAAAALAAQQVRGRNTQVLAPDDGVISARTATVGAVVAAGSELFRLIRKGRLEWRAEVTSVELGRISAGTPALVTGASGIQVRGTVRTIAPTVDPQTRNALVYVDLPAAPAAGALRAGMFARGEFQLGRTRATTVPAAAVVPRDGFNYLLLMQPGDRVSQVKVETGRRVGERVEIVTALPPDGRVVEQGAGFLNDGDLVRVAP